MILRREQEDMRPIRGKDLFFYIFREHYKFGTKREI